MLPGVECRLRGRGGLRRLLCVRGRGTVHGDGLVAAFQQAAQAASGGVQCGLWRVQAVPDLLGYDFEKAVQSVEGGQAVAEVGYRAVAQRAKGIEEFRRKGDLAGELQEGFGGVRSGGSAMLLGAGADSLTRTLSKKTAAGRGKSCWRTGGQAGAVPLRGRLRATRGAGGKQRGRRGLRRG